MADELDYLFTVLLCGVLSLRERAIPDFHHSPLLCSLTFANLIIANNRSISFLRFTVSFLQKRGFPLKAGSSLAILSVKTSQYLLKIRVLGSFLLFVVIFSAFSWAFLVGYVPLFALVFLPLESLWSVIAIFTAATYPTTSHRRFSLRALSFASFSSTLPLSLHEKQVHVFRFF